MAARKLEEGAGASRHPAHLYIRFPLSRRLCLLRSRVYVVKSLESGLDRQGEWLGIHRDGKDEDYMRCVSEFPPWFATEGFRLTRTKIRPTAVKNTAYNGKGKLNVEVKFAPFSCTFLLYERRPDC